MVFPKNGGSVDEIDDFWGECSSNVIILGGVEIKLVDFGGSVVPFHENFGGGKKLVFDRRAGLFVFSVSVFERNYGIPKLRIISNCTYRGCI